MSVICPKCAGSGTNPKSGARCHICGGSGFASWARARTSDPATSHAAAASVNGKLRETQNAVLRLLRLDGDLSDDQLLAAYDNRRRHDSGFPPQSPSGLRTRRRELVALGLVRDSGRRTTTYSGRAAIVWTATTPHDDRSIT